MEFEKENASDEEAQRHVDDGNVHVSFHAHVLCCAFIREFFVIGPVPQPPAGGSFQ